MFASRTFFDAFAPPIVPQHELIESAALEGPVHLIIDPDSALCPLPVRTRTKLLRLVHPTATVLVDQGSVTESLRRASAPFRFEAQTRAVQRDPVQQWSLFHAWTKAELVIRICCIGAESTGKSTLVQALAEKHNTHQIHEFGRDYTVTKQNEGTNDHWTTEDFIAIANRQQELEDAAAVDSGPMLFCDTDAMTTALWHERYLKIRSREVDEIGRKRTYDLFVLCDIDIPWEHDSIRLGADTRASMHKRFLEELTLVRTEPWILASGNVEQRMARVEGAIAELGLLTARSLYAPARFVNHP